VKRKRYHEPCHKPGCREAADSRCTLVVLGHQVFSCVLHGPSWPSHWRAVRVSREKDSQP
jgi:hypothetical protein